MNRLTYHKKIITALSWLKAQVELNNSIALTDINHGAEDFYCGLLNLIYGFKLKNINIINNNAAAIDLGDEDEKVAFQVTSTSALTKTKYTVDKFIEKKLYEKYDKLIILNIVNKSIHRSAKIGNAEYELDTKNDIIDVADLIKAIINDSDLIKLKAIVDFLGAELLLPAHSLLSQDLPTSRLYKFWRDEIEPNGLVYYCCFLPFFYCDVRLSEQFLRRLKSYLAKADWIIKDHEGDMSFSVLLDAIFNFNSVCRDLVTICFLHENKYIEGDECAYWVSCSHLEYFQQEKYISYRKGVLQSLFYQLIKAANYIISINNRDLKGSPHMYIQFKQDEGGIEYFPGYDDRDFSHGKLYPGYYEVDYAIRRQIYLDIYQL
ncbi:SMEK domain-containing protein [Pseudomonas hormoni]